MKTSSSAARAIAASGARRRALLAAAALAVATLTVAGCSGSDAASAPSDPQASTTASASVPGEQSGDTARGRDDGTAVSGLLAAIAGEVAQVQSASAQTAVSWTDETTVQRTVTAGLDAITVGSCVVVLPSDDAGATSDAESTDAPAARVLVSDPVDSECAVGLAAGFGGGGGTGGMPGATGGRAEAGQARPTDLPSGQPTDLPSGVPGGGAGFAPMTAGQVTAVDGTTLTITTTDREGATSEVTATVGSDTVVQHTVVADVGQIEVGQCVSARGTADDRGGLVATSMTLSDAVDGACTVVGFRG